MLLGIAGMHRRRPAPNLLPGTWLGVAAAVGASLAADTDDRRRGRAAVAAAVIPWVCPPSSPLTSALCRAVSHMLGVLESELDVDEHLREVAERMVRVVIGKAGANIERLAAESGAQVSLGPTRRGG